MLPLEIVLKMSVYIPWLSPVVRGFGLARPAGDDTEVVFTVPWRLIGSNGDRKLTELDDWRMRTILYWLIVRAYYEENGNSGNTAIC